MVLEPDDVTDLGLQAASSLTLASDSLSIDFALSPRGKASYGAISNKLGSPELVAFKPNGRL